MTWSGGWNQEKAADQYLWDIQTGEIEYKPIGVVADRCFFDSDIDDTYWIECGSGGVDDCVSYCETTCWSNDVPCGEENPCYKLEKEQIQCKQAGGVPDIFCAGHTNWIDGNPLIQGGNVTGNIVGGAPQSLNRFSSEEETWLYLGETPRRRWYPTVKTLHDGRLLLLGGIQSEKTLTLFAGQQAIPVTGHPWPASGQLTYPYMFQMTDGRMFYAGAEAPGDDSLYDGQVFNPDTFQYEESFTSLIPGGSAVMYSPDKVMKSGGCHDSTDRCEAMDGTEIIDLSDEKPEWEPSCDMPQPRHFQTLTLLPDGTVVMTGGNREGNGSDRTFCRSPNGFFTDNTCNDDSDCDTSVLAGERCEPYDNAQYATRSAALWWPWGGQWIELGEQEHPRMYHSTAILLPDGRVLSAGSGQRQGITSETEVEFFSPPYKFWGAAPVVEDAPESAEYGTSVEVDVSLEGEDDPASHVHRVTMLRLGSVTHQFDMDQRFLELEFEVSDDNTLLVDMPSNSRQMLPGWTMLFVLTDRNVPAKFTTMASLSGAPNPGVPSEGHYLRLDL